MEVPEIMADSIRFALCDDSDIERRIIRFMLDQYIEEQSKRMHSKEIRS